MLNNKFFKKTIVSKKALAGGPASDEQLLAIANNKYWMVLNSDLLNDLRLRNGQLCNKANALKHALQTYGPTHNLFDARSNTGKAEGFIFHGHVNDANGCTYVLEWAIVDTNDVCSVRLMKSEPVEADINQVISLREILIIEKNDSYQMGFCNKYGSYEQKKIKSHRINAFLDTYKAPVYISKSEHKKAIYNDLSSIEGRIFGERTIAFIGFGTHENYPFRQTPLSKDECSRILFSPNNLKIIHHAFNKIEEAKSKVARVMQFHPNV